MNTARPRPEEWEATLELFKIGALDPEEEAMLYLGEPVKGVEIA